MIFNLDINKIQKFQVITTIFYSAKLSPKYNNFPVISYTQICRRTNEFDLEFNSDSNNLIVGVDGSGMKVSNRGEWMREKWKVKRGWVKMVMYRRDIFCSKKNLW